MSEADPVLAARAQGRDDREAFGELVLTHQSAVRRFLGHLTRGNQAWADDLAQETFLTAYRRLEGYGGGSSLQTWLFGIAHNQFRNGRRRERATVGLEALPEADAGARSPADLAEIRNDVAAAMDQLPDDERTALHLCYHQDLSHSEAAQLMGWPLGTLKTHLARGKEQLRLLLKSWTPTT